MIWKEEQTLILADLHLGKITHFRKFGIPLPKHVEKDNLARFSFLLLNFKIKKVLILGDLFHSDYNTEWNRFLNFLAQFEDIEFELVLGNHDILDSQSYKAPNLTVFPISLKRGPFYFTHIPEKTENLYNMCGHVHPAIKMEGKGLQRLRLPCFYFNENQLIIPAFGAFTGTFCVSPEPNDDIYVIADRTILKVL